MKTGQRAAANQQVQAHSLRRFKSDRSVRAYCNMNMLTGFKVNEHGMVTASDPYDRVITIGWIA